LDDIKKIETIAQLGCFIPIKNGLLFVNFKKRDALLAAYFAFDHF